MATALLMCRSWIWRSLPGLLFAARWQLLVRLIFHEVIAVVVRPSQARGPSLRGKSIVQFPSIESLCNRGLWDSMGRLHTNGVHPLEPRSAQLPVIHNAKTEVIDHAQYRVERFGVYSEMIFSCWKKRSLLGDSFSGVYVRGCRSIPTSGAGLKLMDRIDMTYIYHLPPVWGLNLRLWWWWNSPSGGLGKIARLIKNQQNTKKGLIGWLIILYRSCQFEQVPPVKFFFLWTESSHLFLAYEQPHRIWRSEPITCTHCKKKKIKKKKAARPTGPESAESITAVNQLTSNHYRNRAVIVVKDV